MKEDKPEFPWFRLNKSTGEILKTEYHPENNLTKEKEPSEHVEQRNFVSQFRKKYHGVSLHSIPNGATLGDDKKTRSIRGNKLKLEGLLDGIPDLEIPEWYCYIEMKKLSGKLDKDQKEVIEKLRKTHTVIVAYGCDDAMAQVDKVAKEKGWLL